MDHQNDNITFRFQLSMAMISGVSFYLLLQRLYKLQKIHNFVKEENFNDVSEIIENKNLRIFDKGKIKKQHFGFTKLLIQGYIDSQDDKKVHAKDPFVIHDNQYISFYHDTHNHYGLFNSNKINYHISPQLSIKDFNDPTQTIKCMAHKDDLSNLYTLCQQVKMQPYFGFKAFTLGALNFLSLIFKNQKKLEILQEKSDVFAIRSNIPCFMLADIIVNKKSGQFYLRTSEYLAKSPQAIKNLIRKKQLPVLFGTILIGYVAYYFTKKSYKYLLRKFLNYKSYVAMKQSIKKMEQQTQKIEDVHRCVICFDRVRNIILYPCKHVVLCFHCYKEMSKQIMGQKCPICKANIKSVQAIAFKDI